MIIMNLKKHEMFTWEKLKMAIKETKKVLNFLLL